VVPVGRAATAETVMRGLDVPRTAIEVLAANVDEDRLDWSSSDAAQQRSASACVRVCDTLACGEPDSCIGQVPPSAQQAIRASGVPIHPAHTAA
jgi:hypothetical protein